MKGGREQTLLDMVLESTGQAERAWELAAANGRGVLGSVEGAELTERSADGFRFSEELTELRVKGNRRVVKRYGAERTHPSTDLTEADGIGGWRVGGGEVM